MEKDIFDGYRVESLIESRKSRYSESVYGKGNDCL